MSDFIQQPGGNAYAGMEVSYSQGMSGLAAGGIVAGQPGFGQGQIYHFDAGKNGTIIYSFGSGTAGPVSTAPAPTPAPPHLQFSANAIGTPIMLLYGTCRPPGQIIWAAGVDATSNALDTSYLTFCASYGEPIDPGEAIRIQRMWANGTLFYDYALNHTQVQTVANLTPGEQAALQNCYDNMVFHAGGPGELPDPIMEDYLGVGNVPAYRGLRTIVFPDLPLAVSGNSVPNISVEFKRTDTDLVNVSDVLGAFIAAYLARIGYTATVQIDNIDDQATGFVVQNGTALDVLIGESAAYRYQILDGDPIRIVRRQVNGSLSYDLSIDEADCVRRGDAPAITYERIDPTSMPIGIDFQYSDPDNYYDTRIQSSRYEGFSVSSVVTSLPTKFIMDATTARTLSFGTLFDIRSRSLRISFELDNVETEPSDAIELTASTGDVYGVLVDEQSYTKTRSGTVRGMALLTSAGVDVAGDGGSDGGAASRKSWPEDVVFSYALAVDGDRIWSASGSTIAFNYTSPLRKLTHGKWLNLQTAVPSWAVIPSNVNQVLLDASYAYFIADNQAIITRVSRFGTIRDHSTLEISDGMSPNSSDGQGAQIHNGKIYIAYRGDWGGASSQMKLVEVDLSLWDAATGVNVYDYSTDAVLYGFIMGFNITDNGIALVSTQPMSPTGFGQPGRVYYADLSSPSSWNDFDFSFSAGVGATYGNNAYFVEGQNRQFGHLYLATSVAQVDCTSLPPAVTEVAMTDDPYITSISQNALPWVANGSLYLVCNDVIISDFVSTNRPYIAKRTLPGLATSGGEFVRNLMYNEKDAHIASTTFNGTKHYLNAFGYGFTGIVMVVDENLSAMTIYPGQGALPANNYWQYAAPLSSGSSFGANLFYANTEDTEPLQPGVAGYDLQNNAHSIWYRFVAPASTSYTFTTGPQGYHSAVYTGTTLAGLSHVTDSGTSLVNTSNTSTWSATAGVTYYIRVIGLSALFVNTKGSFTASLS